MRRLLKPGRYTREQHQKYLDQVVGNFIAIPLDGEFGFGRIVNRALVAFYDLKSPTILPIEVIEKAPVLFTVGVDFVDLKSDRWKVIGKKPLEPALAKPMKFFRQDIFTLHVDIYIDDRFVPYTGEDLSKMEPLSAWSARLVESRLRHHFAGTLDPVTEKAKYDPTRHPHNPGPFAKLPKPPRRAG
ncbi:MAG: Imm26 family immunity protein [Rhodospirillales bacterium]